MRFRHFSAVFYVSVARAEGRLNTADQRHYGSLLQSQLEK